MQRGDVYDVLLPGGQRPGVLVTRDTALPVLTNVTVVVVTSTVHGVMSEVALGPEQGLDHECVANCDNVFTVTKRALVRRRGRLGPVETRQLDDALRVALQLDV